MFSAQLLRNICRIRTSGHVSQGQIISPNLGPFPYIFGGFKQQSPSTYRGVVQNNPEIHKTIQEFLWAIQKKDQKLLSSMVLPQLLNPLLAPGVEVKIVGENQKALTILNFQQFGMMSRFQRGNQQFQVLNKNHKSCLYAPSAGIKALFTEETQQFTCLVSVHLSVQGGPQLMPKDENKPYSPEQHSLTLEKQGVITLKDVFKTLLRLGRLQDLIKNSKNPWKVGNIDNFLKPRINR